MEIYKILDELEAEIENSSRIPLTDKFIIKEEIIFEYIDLMRANLPEDMRASKLIKHDEEKIIEDAKAEAEKIIEDAKAKVVELTDEAEITKLAEKKSEHMLAIAKEQSEELIRGAFEYSDTLLANLQLEFEENIEKIKEGRRQIDDANKQVD